MVVPTSSPIGYLTGDKVTIMLTQIKIIGRLTDLPRFRLGGLDWRKVELTNAIKLVAATCACGVLLLACNSKEDDTAIRMAQVKMRTSEHLSTVLTPGTHTNDIVKAIGFPQLAAAEGTNLVRWDYDVPRFVKHGPASETYVTGLTIFVTNGQLASWGYDYQTIPTSLKQTEVLMSTAARNETSDGVSSQPLTLDLYVVSDVPIPEGRFIDTKAIPKLGFIPPLPDLVITNLQEVVMEQRASTAENSDHIVYVFRITLATNDGTQLGLLTTTNVGRRILMMLGQEPLFAPTVMAPLLGGSFDFNCPQDDRAEFLKGRLAKLVRQQ